MAIQLFSDSVIEPSAVWPQTPLYRLTHELELPSPLETPTSEKVRQILAYLLLKSGQIVTSEELKRELWEKEVKTHTIFTHISVLRKALGDNQREARDHLIQTVPAGYRVNIDPREVDVLRFVALVRGIGLREDDDEESLRHTLTKLESSLKLIRGPILKDIEHGRALGNIIQKLNEYIRTAHTQRAEVALMLGQHQRIAAELFEVYTNDPSDEVVARLWMLALYRCTRRQEACKVYRELQKLLAEEFGVDPSPQVELLHTKILQGDRELFWNFRTLV